MRLPRPYWSDMTALDLSVDTGAWVAVVPVAAVEQHGPHLPLGTDWMIAEGLVKATVERLPEDLPVTFLPVQTIGKSNEHIAYRGTVTLAWETAIKGWLEIATSLARAGLRRIVFINSHGGNTAMLDVVTRELRVRFDMLAVHTHWMKFGDGGAVDDKERAIGIHGGALETAIMRHLRPSLVREDKLADFKSAQTTMERDFKHLRAHGTHAFAWKAGDLNPNGVVGNAKLGTAEMGAAIVAHQAEAFVELLREVATVNLSVLK